MNPSRQLSGAPMLAAAVLWMMAAPASAASGQLLSAYSQGGAMGVFGSVSVVDSTPQWACDGSTCALSAPLRTSLVFAPADGHPVAVTSQSLTFDLHVRPLVSTLIDPLGHSWEIAPDTNKWAIGVDIASQARPAGEDAQFITAYGQFGFKADEFTMMTFWPQGKPIADHGGVSDEGLPLSGESHVLGLTEHGQVRVGPGSDGVTLGPIEWDWYFQTHLDGARYAYPSTTDVHCSSLECMDYKTGIVNVNSYFLSFDVIAVPSAVPEIGTSAAMGLGMLGVMAVTRRRRR